MLTSIPKSGGWLLLTRLQLSAQFANNYFLYGRTGRPACFMIVTLTKPTAPLTCLRPHSDVSYDPVNVLRLMKTLRLEAIVIKENVMLTFKGHFVPFRWWLRKKALYAVSHLHLLSCDQPAFAVAFAFDVSVQLQVQLFAHVERYISELPIRKVTRMHQYSLAIKGWSFIVFLRNRIDNTWAKNFFVDSFWKTKFRLIFINYVAQEKCNLIRFALSGTWLLHER